MTRENKVIKTTNGGFALYLVVSITKSRAESQKASYKASPKAHTHKKAQKDLNSRLLP